MSEIPGVVHRLVDPNNCNSRPQRVLVGIINGDLDIPQFPCQLKVLDLHTADWLGKQGHFHTYAELYFVLEGEATFDLVDHRATGNAQRYVVKKGQLLFIPARVAHRAYGTAGLIMIALTEQPYQEGSDIPHNLSPLGPVPYGLE